MGEDVRKIIYDNIDSLKNDIPFFESEFLKIAKKFIAKNYMKRIKKLGYELKIQSGGSFTKKNTCVYNSGIYIEATKGGKEVRYNDYEPDLAYVTAGWVTMEAKKRLFKKGIELIIYAYNEELMNEELGDIMNKLEDEENIIIL